MVDAAYGPPWGAWAMRGYGLTSLVLIGAMVAIVVGNVAVQLPDPRAVATGWLLDAAGNVLALAAALALIVRRGSATWAASSTPP